VPSGPSAGGATLDASTLVPLLWSQATTTTAPATGTTMTTPTGSGGVALSSLVLALRRWCGSLTLSSPDPTVGPLSGGLWAWLLALAALLIAALVFQGPARALGQLLDVAGHARLVGSAWDRVRRSGRLLAVAVGISVLAWTANQTFYYSVPTSRDDLLLLTKGHRLADVALGQGVLAALTPLRDVVGLGLLIPLLVGASVVLFQFSTDRWGSTVRPPWQVRRRAARWSTIGWGVTALYALYRFVSLVSNNPELPLGGCMVLEAAVLPALMVMADGVLVAWVLVEIRNAGLGDQENDALDVCGATLLIPAAALGCLLAFPGRYVATGTWLTVPYLLNYAAPGTPLASYLRWQLGWGLVDLQGVGLAFVGLFGAVAWSRGTPGDALRGYGRMIAAEGGHLVAALALGGLAAGALSAAAYLLVLSLPASTWALAAADGYAHYATLPIGLVLLAALVELGERSLPAATLAEGKGEKASA